MLITKRGVIIGELVAQTDTFGNPAWDAYAIHPKTGERKMLETFVKQAHQDGMKVLKDAEKAVKKHAWPVEPACKRCKAKPEDLIEMRIGARQENMTPLEFLKEYEGTYNPKTGEFYCVTCYIKAGMPVVGKA